MATLALAACRTANDDGVGEASTPSVAVSVETVAAHEIRDSAQGIGTIEAPRTVELRAEVGAKVRSIGFVEGGSVKRGQLLFDLDDSVMQRRLQAQKAALSGAAARLTNARQTLRRTRTLSDKGATTEASLDAARSEARAAEAEADRLRGEIAVLEEQIDDTRIVAPFAGRISERKVDVGDWVSPGEPLAVLYDAEAGPLVAFRLPERSLGRVRTGGPVEVTSDVDPDRTFPGRIVFVAPAVDPLTRDLLLKASVEDPEGRLRPGGSAAVETILEVHREQPVIPEEALVGTRTGYLVFVVEDGKARRRDVEIGLRVPGRVEIRSGLAPGERVVVQGQLRLADGDRVRIVGTPSPDAGAARAGGAT